jgi:hypothetical protein
MQVSLNETNIFVIELQRKKHRRKLPKMPKVPKNPNWKKLPQSPEIAKESKLKDASS